MIDGGLFMLVIGVALFCGQLVDRALEYRRWLRGDLAPVPLPRRASRSHRRARRSRSSSPLQTRR
jgi:hypothetical protein